MSIPLTTDICAAAEINLDDLEPHHEEQLFDLLRTVPSAIYCLHRLSLHADTLDTNHGFNRNIVQGINLICNTFSDFHSSMDTVNLAAKNMQMMLGEAGQQIFNQTINLDEPLTQIFDLFDACMSAMQSTAAVGSQKMAVIENRMHQCLEFLNYFCQQLIQYEHDSNESLNRLDLDRELIASRNDFSFHRQKELQERKRKIDDSVAEIETSFHSAVAEVRCDGKLLAADIAIEMAFDVIFFFVPFLNAVEFVDEAVVVVRYLAKQVARYTEVGSSKFFACFKKNESNEIGDDSDEKKRTVYKYFEMISEFVDEFEQFLSEDDGRLAYSIVSVAKLQTELKWKLITFLELLSNLPESRMLGKLMGLCICGVAVCEMVEKLEFKQTDPTTAEADQIADEIRKFIITAQEFVIEAEHFSKNLADSKRDQVHWYHVLWNGFTGYRTKNKLLLVQTTSEAIQNEENRLRAVKRNLRKEIVQGKSRELHETVLQMRKSQQNSRLQSVLELQVIVAELKSVWNTLCVQFGYVEVLLRSAAEKICCNNFNNSDFVGVRYAAYHSAFEAVKLFDNLSKFTNAYLAISNKYFLPLLISLSQSIEQDGCDPDLAEVRKIEFEDKIIRVVLAIEESFLMSNTSIISFQ
jgi:hypothetical protein